jgi:hypothetical protein
MSWPVLEGMRREQVTEGVGLVRLGETSLPDHCVPQCALQDGLVQVAAVALPGAPIKVDPGAPGLALDCVYHRSRTGHVDALL